MTCLQQTCCQTGTHLSKADDASLHDLCSSLSAVRAFVSGSCSLYCVMSCPVSDAIANVRASLGALLSTSCSSYATGTEPTKMFTASRDVPRPPVGVTCHTMRCSGYGGTIDTPSELTRVTDAMPARSSRSDSS
jgi:hypothetical protein